MKRFSASALLAAACISAACTNLERSRDLANPDVPPAVTAVQVCSNCHGFDGNSVSPNFPRLAGQQKDYLVAQLQNFRSRDRSTLAGSQYMWGIARSLTDQQIDGLAEYFSQQTPTPNDPLEEKQIALGKQIFENGLEEKEAPPCLACHGPEAQGMMTFPRLADQHQHYLVKQLHVFQDDDGRPGTPMKQVARLLSHEEMEAVAAYLHSFRNSR